MQFWQTVYDLYRTEFEQNLNRIEEFLCLLFLVTYLKSSFLRTALCKKMSAYNVTSAVTQLNGHNIFCVVFYFNIKNLLQKNNKLHTYFYKENTYNK